MESTSPSSTSTATTAPTSTSTSTSLSARKLSKNPSSSDSDSSFPTDSLLVRDGHTHNRIPSSSTTTSTTSAPPLKLTLPKSPSPRSKRYHKSSPLSFTPSSSPPHPIESEEEWDNTPTARWGYLLLLTTWLVFVIGMGSCFDVWSWAWDVGETPYAPPELEDDPTLPIVGYYPALIILTAVMAWVWVGFAWVGMKYFKHAKITGE